MRGTWSVLPNRCPYVNTSVVKPLISCSFSRRHAEYANGEGVIFDVIIRVAHAFRGDTICWRIVSGGTVFFGGGDSISVTPEECFLSRCQLQTATARKRRRKFPSIGTRQIEVARGNWTNKTTVFEDIFSLHCT